MAQLMPLPLTVLPSHPLCHLAIVGFIQLCNVLHNMIFTCARKLNLSQFDLAHGTKINRKK